MHQDIKIISVTINDIIVVESATTCETIMSVYERTLSYEACGTEMMIISK